MCRIRKRTRRTSTKGSPLTNSSPTHRAPESRCFAIPLAFKDKLAVSSADLDLQSDLIVADTINGKRLGADHPFCSIAKNSHGEPVVIKELAYIKVVSTL
jgi:hypothetical protein